MRKLSSWAVPVGLWLVVSIGMGAVQVWADLDHAIAAGLAAVYGSGIWLWITWRVAKHLDSHLFARKAIALAKARARW